jgi:hypothetical protein
MQLSYICRCVVPHMCAPKQLWPLGLFCDGAATRRIAYKLAYGTNFTDLSISLVLIFVKFPPMSIYTKNGGVWDVTPCGSCKNGRFGGT